MSPAGLKYRDKERGDFQMDGIIFLGTAGARIVVSKQIRASGGIWLSLEGTNTSLDPGPGALVRCRSRKEKLDPAKLDAIVLSHKHLDHSADVNVMIEAMTDGGFKKRGLLFAPEDALTGDPVILRYVREYVDKVVILEENGEYAVGAIKLSCPVRHIHGDVETYGFNFRTPDHTISYVADTRFFSQLLGYYRGDVLIINVLRLEPSPLDHLCVDDVRRIVGGVKPRVAILTHFGMTLLRAKPWEVAARLSEETGVRVIAARDGMSFDLGELEGGRKG